MPGKKLNSRFITYNKLKEAKLSNTNDILKMSLEDAEKICDGSWYLKKIRDANDRGLSLFEYNRKKSSLNEEAEKK